MPDTTTIQSLPLIQPSQAQKHVTHNEAMKRVDVMIQLAAVNRTLTTPPGSPVTGQCHIVAAGAAGDWAGHETEVAVYSGTIWEFFAPRLGWQAWLEDEGEQAVYDGAGWVSASEGPAVFTELGVSATPDATNRLTVSAPATLLNNAGAGHQLKINKAAAGDTASLLFQTGFSGRAEMGTTGSDDFAIKVSPDGASFFDGLTVDKDDGRVTAMNGLVLNPGSGDLATPGDGSLWYNSTAGRFRAQIGGAAADVLTSAHPVALDSSFTLQDDGDASKQAQFQLSAITPATTRTLTVPDADGTLVLTAASQTLTNKTIDLGANTITGTLAAAQEPAHTGDVTNAAGSLALTIASNAVTLAKMATLATARFLGRSTAGTGDPEAMTGTQATALLDQVTSALKGLAPASGGGTANFLRADGTWVDPRTRYGLVPFAPAAGVFIANTLTAAALGTQVGVANRTVVSSWTCPYGVIIDQMGVSVVTGAASSNVKCIIYAADGTGGAPGTVIAETPNISTATSATTPFGTLASAVTLEAGRQYWIGVRSSGTPTLSAISITAVAPVSWTNASPPTPMYALQKSEAFANAAAAFGYAAANHTGLVPTLVLMRVA